MGIKGKEIVVEESESEEEVPVKAIVKTIDRTYYRNNARTRACDIHLRPITKKMDKHDNDFVKAMAMVQIEPTRFACEGLLERLGLLEDVELVFTNMGFGKLYRLCHHTHPVLVREFVATCRLTYEDPKDPGASQGKLTFFLNKKSRSLSLYEFCDIYGFSHGEEVAFPRFENSTQFWNLIGTGRYTSKEAKIAKIRNPVLRLVAKIISNTFFFKAESGSVRDDELWMIYYGVKHLLVEYQDKPDNNVNFGAILATMFVNLKKTAPKSKKALHMGTILTPLFLSFEDIDLTTTETIKKRPTINIKYLENCHILKKRTVRQYHEPITYRYMDRAGKTLFCELPQPNITSLVSRQNIEFLPGPEHLVNHPDAGNDLSDHADDDDIAEHQHHHATYSPQPHHLLPADSTEYNLPPVPPQDAEAERQQWIIDAGVTNNTMLHKIWGAISKIRPCRCASHPKVQEMRNQEKERRSKGAHDLQSGAEANSHSSSDTGEIRLSRRRRKTGHSQSASESSSNRE